MGSGISISMRIEKLVRILNPFLGKMNPIPAISIAPK